MAGLGTILIAIMLAAAALAWTGRLETNRPMLWILMMSFPFPYIAVMAGWMTAELGRQPWLVYGLLRTAEGVEPERALRHGHLHAHRLLRPLHRALACCSSSSWRARSRAARPRTPSDRAERRRRMFEIWYAITVFMLTAYVVLDGFDFGAGALHLLVAKNDARAAPGPRRDRPLLGRQRGLAARRRRSALRRLSAGPVGRDLGLLLRDLPRALVPDPPGDRDRAPEPRGRPALARHVRPVLLASRACCSRSSSGRPSATCCAALPLVRGRLVRARALHGLHGEGARRHPRLVHGFDRGLRARGPRRPRRGVSGVEDGRRGRGPQPPFRAAALRRRSPSCGPS